MTGTPVWPQFALKSDRRGLPDLGGHGAPRRPLPDQPHLALRRVRAVRGRRRRRSPTSTPGGSRASCASGRTGSSTSSATRSGTSSCSAVVLPGIVFTVLALWPFLEARVTRDHATHHFAQRPREAPVRTAIGAGGHHLVRGADARRAATTSSPSTSRSRWTRSTRWLRVLVFVLPAVAGSITFWICRDLGRARPGRSAIAGPGHVPADRGRRLRRGARGLAASSARARTLATRRDARSLLRRRRRDLAGRVRRVVLVVVRDAARRDRAGAGHLPPLADLHDRRDRGGGVRLRPDRVVAHPVPAPQARRPRTRAAGPFDANVPLEVVYTAIPVVIVVVLFALSVRTEDRVDAVSRRPRRHPARRGLRVGVALHLRRRRAHGGEPPERRGRGGPDDRAPAGANHARGAHVERRDPRVLGPGLPVQARRDPGTHDGVRPHAHRPRRVSGRCAEFCGLNHAFMTFTVRVVEPSGVRRMARGATLGGGDVREHDGRTPARRGAAPEPPKAPGPVAWLTTTDHKKIGILYCVTAFAFFLIGGALADSMRTELAEPGRQLLSNQAYNASVHDPRHGDDLPVRRAVRIGPRQLPDPVADRRARHGVPPAQRALLLVLRGRRAPRAALGVRLGGRGRGDGMDAYTPLSGGADVAGRGRRTCGSWASRWWPSPPS